MQPRLLVFPSNIDSAENTANMAHSLGFCIFGACSVPTDRALPHIIENIQLPFINESNFVDEFKLAIQRHEISHVYSPHSVVWWYLKQLTEQKLFNFTLCGSHPYDEHWSNFSPSWTWAENQVVDSFAHLLPKYPNIYRPLLGMAQLAGLHRRFITTPGESDENKLSALCAISSITPPGDVVEIGSLYGRSALALSWLSTHFQIGSTVCVDPWNLEKTTNQGNEAEMVLVSGRHIEMEKIFLNFLSTIATLQKTSYIRETSSIAIEIYKNQLPMDSSKLIS